MRIRRRLLLRSWSASKHTSQSVSASAIMDLEHLAVAGLECDEPGRFKLSGEAVVEANDG